MVGKFAPKRKSMLTFSSLSPLSCNGCPTVLLSKHRNDPISCYDQFDVTRLAVADEWLLLVMDLKCFVFLSCNLRLVFSTHVDLLAVLTTSRISNPGHLSTGEPFFVGKKRHNTMRALENNSKVKAAVKFIDTSLHVFGEDSVCIHK